MIVYVGLFENRMVREGNVRRKSRWGVGVWGSQRQLWFMTYYLHSRIATSLSFIVKETAVFTF